MNNKNVILLTGRNVTGKTTYQRVLSTLLAPCHLITDQVFYKDAILKDDLENRGRGHIHPKTHAEIFGVKELEDGGHIHENLKKGVGPLPAMAISERIIDDVYATFFREVKLLKTDSYIIAELGGAKNACSKGESQAHIDCSFTTKARLLLSGEYEIGALDRVLCCIHLEIDDALRYKRLEARKDLNKDILRVMEIDDFEGPFSDLLRTHNIPIEKINNNEDLTDDQIAINLKVLLDKYRG